MRVIAAIVFLFFCAAGAINAEALTRVVSETSDATALTIYPDNLALITETRTIDLPKGQSTIVFSGVSDRMIPASVLLRAFSGFTLERNFDYARLDKANLFAKSVGQYVTVTRTNRKSGKVSRDRAKIISAKQGVVLEIDGRYEAFQCSGLAEGTRFDKIPDGLRGVPELSIDVETQTAGPQTLVISYLADHFSWEADYRMDITEQGQRAKLLGWLTIENETSKTFKNAPLAIVAGELNRGYKTRAPDFTPTYLFANCWPRGSSKTGIRDPLPMISRQTSDKIGYMPPAPVAQAYGEADEIVVT
ncbi:MAG TPA: hypothetical protein ENJ42_04045, partial [Hellea balneolensis]|nr:hypothetical protein [Hellea balneolensis]